MGRRRAQRGGDTTIRNLDPAAYRRLKAYAALTGKTIGEVLNEAIRAYLETPRPATSRGSLADWQPESYPPGTERLSEEIDRVVYGDPRTGDSDLTDS